MNSSGIKRGLAVSAISALAIAGIPQIANADTINDQVGAGAVDLYTQYSGAASVQNDGVNTTVHLLAGGGSDVAQVRFQYDDGVNPVATIATVSRTNGVFSTEWAPPVAIYGTAVDIIAVGLNSVGNPIAGATDINTATVGANSSAVDIANAPGSTVGVFRQPYGLEDPEVAGTPFNGVSHDTAPAIITGSTSGAGAVELSDLSDGSRVFPAAAANPVPGDAVNGVRPFRGTANFSDYDFDSTAPVVNEAIVGASQAATGGSDDAEVLNLREQTITTVTATATPASVPNGQTAAGVVTVQDQFGELLSGAQVIFDADKDGVWDDNEAEGYTNANGQVSFTGLAGSAAGTTYEFFVNTTDGDDFEPAVDFRRSVTVTSFAQVPTTVTATSADGAAFDVDEYKPAAGATLGDITARVVDQNGNGIPNQTVSYRVTFVPFVPATPTPVVYTPRTGSATTNADGRINIPFTPEAVGGTYTVTTFVERDGTPGQSAGDLSGTDLVFKAGQAELAFNDGDTEAEAAGTTAVFDATLELADGTPLAGRLVNFTYAPSGNSQLAAQANQPAGTTQTSINAANDTTDANGVVSVAVSDPTATPQPAELNNTLTAATATNTIGNAGASDSIDIDFASTQAPANAIVTISPIGTTRPGEPIQGTVRVQIPSTVAGGAPSDSVGQQVTLELPAASGAFFTDRTFDPAPAVGADGGEFTSLGKTITVTTGAGGVSEPFYVTIERDAGFDDDGLVEAIVTARAGTAAAPDTEDVDFDSAGVAPAGGVKPGPLNGGEVQLVLSPEDEQDGGTTPADTDQDVFFDVYTTDQFGNRVGGESVNITAEGDDDDSDVDTDGVTAGAVLSDFDDDGDFSVTSADADDVTVTASWNTATSKFVADTAADADTIPDGPVAGTETLTDTADVTFADLTFATATLTGSPEASARVGTPVTETFTAKDSNGNPLAGITVRFSRSGSAGVETTTRTTNADGVATYVFTSTATGTTVVNAEATALGETKSATDSVTFTPSDSTPGRTDIRVNTTGGQANGGRTDIIRIRVTGERSAAGAQATLFRKVGNRNVRLAVKRVGTNDRAEFRVRDRNGVRNLSSYFVVVSATDDTKGRRGPVKKFR